VEVKTDTERAGDVYHYLAITGAAGENNEFAVTGDPGDIVVQDTGAPLTVGPGCVATGPGARCTGTFASVVIDAGDGDDRVVTAVGAFVDGGAGNDVLIANAAAQVEAGIGDDVLQGDDHRQILRPGIGVDTVLAGGGDDEIDAGDYAPVSAPDHIDGGPGTDELNYAVRDQPLTIDLAAGSGADGGTVAGIEWVNGGNGDDTILGTDGHEILYGAVGNDHIDGRSGDDNVRGGEGDDVLLGGPGNDVVEGTAGNDRADCGPGADELTMFTGTLSRCETLIADPLEIRLRAGSLRVRWRLKSRTPSCRLYVTSGGGRVHTRPARTWRTVPLERRHGQVTLQLDDHCGGRVGSRFPATRFVLA
jgi:Ca2+-binding RTX toxin-like protein